MGIIVVKSILCIVLLDISCSLSAMDKWNRVAPDDVPKDTPAKSTFTQKLGSFLGKKSSKISPDLETAPKAPSAQVPAKQTVVDAPKIQAQKPLAPIAVESPQQRKTQFGLSPLFKSSSPDRTPTKPLESFQQSAAKEIVAPKLLEIEDIKLPAPAKLLPETAKKPEVISEGEQAQKPLPEPLVEAALKKTDDEINDQSKKLSKLDGQLSKLVAEIAALKRQSEGSNLSEGKKKSLSAKLSSQVTALSKKQKEREEEVEKLRDLKAERSLQAKLSPSLRRIDNEINVLSAVLRDKMELRGKTSTQLVAAQGKTDSLARSISNLKTEEGRKKELKKYEALIIYLENAIKKEQGTQANESQRADLENSRKIVTSLQEIQKDASKIKSLEVLLESEKQKAEGNVQRLDEEYRKMEESEEERDLKKKLVTLESEKKKLVEEQPGKNLRIQLKELENQIKAANDVATIRVLNQNIDMIQKELEKRQERVEKLQKMKDLDLDADRLRYISLTEIEEPIYRENVEIAKQALENNPTEDSQQLYKISVDVLRKFLLGEKKEIEDRYGAPPTQFKTLKDAINFNK